MKTGKIYSILFVFLLSWGVLRAQRQGVIIDKATQTTIPFATVSYTVAQGQEHVIVAGAQGQFALPAGVEQANVSCMGYKPKGIRADAPAGARWVVELEEETYAIKELFVTPKNNPAIRIIRNVLANKDRNNFEQYGEYSYRNYLKIGVAKKAVEADSSMGNKNASQADALFSETVTLTNKRDGRIEDRIVANRSAGFDTPILGQAFYMFFHKAISFYANAIAIFGEDGLSDRMQTNYAGPLGAGCLSGYNYQLENTYLNEADTLFEISYFPKKHANFESLAGTMFISSNGYGIAKIIAQPYAKGLIGFKFKQEYELVEGKWFPKRLEEEIGFLQAHPKKNPGAYMAYVAVSVIDSVRYEVPLQGKYFDKISIDERSVKNSLDIINAVRPDTLAKKEEELFGKLDSAFRKIHFEDIIYMLPKIDYGKISTGKFDIDLPRIYTKNTVEGTRWGFGLHTNERLAPYLSFGLYGGFGVGDRKLKYGGEIDFTLDRQRTAHLKLSRQNTLNRTGGTMDFNMADDYGLALAASRFEYSKENKVEGSFHLSRPLRVQASLSTRDVKPAYESVFRGAPLADYKADAAQLSVRYAVGEQHTLLMGVTRSVTSIGNPVFTANYTRGITFLRKNSFAYNKWEAAIDWIAYNGRIGQSNVRLQGGYLDRALPYGMLFTGEGSYSTDAVSFVTRHSFQTMRPDEFLSDKYVHLFYKHNFGALFFKTKSLRPELSLACNAGWGSLHPSAAVQGVDYKLKEKIYREAGIIVDNIVRIPLLRMFYLRLGFGGFMRLGYYRLDKPADNLALKASITFSYK
ncbi:membrane protein [Bacteroidia bacterium]|nr:membrane protein [Bacteroidia bacterium]